MSFSTIINGCLPQFQQIFVGIILSCHASRIIPYDTEDYNRKEYFLSNEDSSEEFEYQNAETFQQLLNEIKQYDDFASNNPRESIEMVKKSLGDRSETSSTINDRYFRNAFMFKNRTVQCHAIPHEIDLYRKFGLAENDQLHESFPRKFKEWKCKRVQTEDVDNYVEYPCTYFPENMGDKRLCYVTTTHEPCRSLKKPMFFWIRRQEGHWEPVRLEVNAGCHCNYEFIHI